MASRFGLASATNGWPGRLAHLALSAVTLGCAVSACGSADRTPSPDCVDADLPELATEAIEGHLAAAGHDLSTVSVSDVLTSETQIDHTVFAGFCERIGVVGAEEYGSGEWGVVVFRYPSADSAEEALDRYIDTENRSEEVVYAPRRDRGNQWISHSGSTQGGIVRQDCLVASGASDTSVLRRVTEVVAPLADRLCP